MRRVNCRRCGVKVEEVPWGTGKHQLTKAYMLYLAQWARKLSWKETAQSFHTNWEKVHQAVAYVVEWGLVHRQLGPIRAIGVDEIAYGKGHQYLTLVYQIESNCTRLLWVGEKRTKEAFQKFFDLIEKNCTNALNILDRFHVVAKLNLAIDEIRAGEARQLIKDGYGARLLSRTTVSVPSRLMSIGLNDLSCILTSVTCAQWGRVGPSCPRRLFKLPAGHDRVLGDERIGCQDDHLVGNGLADQHAVEGVAMDVGHFAQDGAAFFVHLQAFDAMSAPRFFHVIDGQHLVWQLQFP
jgi:hypothetical protein